MELGVREKTSIWIDILAERSIPMMADISRSVVENANQLAKNLEHLRCATAPSTRMIIHKLLYGYA